MPSPAKKNPNLDAPLSSVITYLQILPDQSSMIGLLPRFQCLGQAFFPLVHEFSPLDHESLGVLANLPTLARHIVLPFIGFLCNQLSRLFAGLGSQQQPGYCAEPKA